LTDETRRKRPRYYLQNFHYQSGGWMTDDSAERYDTQVEVLFNGTANATRGGLSFLRAMSAIGPKQTSLVAPHMSALRGKADIWWRGETVAPLDLEQCIRRGGPRC
jgi:hypothetical protein